jgi:hypothetical protein
LLANVAPNKFPFIVLFIAAVPRINPISNDESGYPCFAHTKNMSIGKNYET